MNHEKTNPNKPNQEEKINEINIILKEYGLITDTQINTKKAVLTDKIRQSKNQIKSVKTQWSKNNYHNTAYSEYGQSST